MNYTNKHGHLNDETIALYVDALKLDKTDEMPEEVLQHIDDCNICHSQAIELYAGLKTVDYSGIGKHPTFEKAENISKPSGKWWPVGLLALIAGLILVWLLFFKTTGSEQSEDFIKNDIENVVPENETPVDTLKSNPAIEKDQKGNEPFMEEENNESPSEEHKNTQPELIAMDFTPSEELENQVGEIYRSDDIEIDGPLNEERFKTGQTISLRWSNTNSDAIVIKVFDNRENLILLRNGAKSPYRIGDLKPGLYYWKLETEDDLIHVGKFFVDNND